MSKTEQLKERYQKYWRSHASKVLTVRQILVATFPFLEHSIAFGHGANTDKEISAYHETGEADLIIYFDYQPVAEIEISGSRKVLVPPNNFWVRPDKIHHGFRREQVGISYWLWLEYPGTTYILNLPTLDKFKFNRKGFTYDGITEEYVEIPWEFGLSPVVLFKWLKDRLNRRSS